MAPSTQSITKMANSNASIPTSQQQQQQMMQQQQQKQWPRQQQLDPMQQQQQPPYMSPQFAASQFMGQMGMPPTAAPPQMNNNFYGQQSMEYPPNLPPEVIHQLKSLGADERPYFEKVCQLQQFIGFLQSGLTKYQSDQPMVNRINTMLSVLRFERLNPSISSLFIVFFSSFSFMGMKELQDIEMVIRKMMYSSHPSYAQMQPPVGSHQMSMDPTVKFMA
jgi:hypothetical protein